MLFNSVPFLIFFVITTGLFFALPGKAKNVVLLAASYFFYMWWNPLFVLLILFTTLVSYFAALFMEKKPQRKKTFMILSVVVIFVQLFFFKYYNFFAGGLSMLLGAVTGKTIGLGLNILLPVGISFYTFQTVSYVIDVYRGKIPAEKNLFFYALFVSFFPQLVAGPIERPGDLIPQLKAEHRFSAENVLAGGRIMVIGFFEKIAVADMLGIVVNRVYENITGASGAAVAVATLLFCVQILCDFKGYSDIAKGIALIYGIRLSTNFDHPYRAGSIKEFWNRWHITLSAWFRDYVYFPLGGGRVRFFRWCLNILIVFLLSGLWHGADITFVLWGVVLALFRILENPITRKQPPQNRASAIFRHAMTFLIVALAWVLFRGNSLAEVGIAYRALFTQWDLSTAGLAETWSFLQLSLSKVFFGAAILLLFLFYEKILARLDACCSKGGRAVPAKIGKVLFFAVLIWATIGSFIYLNAAGVESSFIYFRF